ncbi:MAG TPA: DUF3108 domain-containing protein [Syntrophales bacterium]|nr:DUF3108 domain-containing protein [Syntrophales bacterium]
MGGFRNKTLLCMLAVFILSADAAAEPTASPPVFWKGEHLVFKLSWLGIPAGMTVLDTSDALYLGGKKMYGISAVTTSNQFVDAFYPVRDRIHSLVLADTLASYKYVVRQEEGTYRSDKEIIFDYAERKATFTKNGEVSICDIPAFVSDSLSAYYYFRTKELAVGKAIAFDVFDDKKLWEVHVQILRRERIETPAGAFDTIVVKPHFKFEGIFRRKGDIYFWLTDDSRKMMVRMKSKVIIGSINADLIEYAYRPSHDDARVR